MSKIMLINVTHAEESRVGIVDDGQLESFEIESFSREHLKGNIYKGTVRRIHPAIEAAFVDIGAERDAFLPLDEICFRNLPAGRNGTTAEKGRRRIKDVLKSGDEILVQIIKGQFTNKPPTLSTFYSLPGRYLVLLPGADDAGISRKIEGEDRIRLRQMLGHLQLPPGCGVIVRTAAGFDEDQGELERDLTYLTRLWESITRSAETKRAPAVIYREHDLVLRNIRDYFTPDISEIVIDNEEVHERARDFLQNVMPGKESILRLYTGDQPIFSHFGVEAQIESIYKRRVPLKSGGSIVIDGTEALTAIDVNSGGSMRGASQEETAYKTNLEAAREIARQLRLRDLGGIIVVDFIDMREPKHIAEVERAIRDAMRADKARHDVGRISRLGLLEISRQRLRPTAASSSYTACPMCEGHGSIRTTESAALVALRKIHHRIAAGDVAQMKVGLPREVAMYLLNQKREDLATLEVRYAARIQVGVDDGLMPHQLEIEVRTREVMTPPPAVRPGEVVSAELPTPPVNGATPQAAGAERRPAGTAAASRRAAPPASAGGAARAAGELGARRRRRRGGRGRRPTAAAGEAGALRQPAAGTDVGSAAAPEGVAEGAGETQAHDAWDRQLPLPAAFAILSSGLAGDPAARESVAGDPGAREPLTAVESVLAPPSHAHDSGVEPDASLSPFEPMAVEVGDAPPDAGERVAREDADEVVWLQEPANEAEDEEAAGPFEAEHAQPPSLAEAEHEDAGLVEAEHEDAGPVETEHAHPARLAEAEHEEDAGPVETEHAQPPRPAEAEHERPLGLPEAEYEQRASLVEAEYEEAAGPLEAEHEQPASLAEPEHAQDASPADEPAVAAASGLARRRRRRGGRRGGRSRRAAGAGGETAAAAGDTGEGAAAPVADDVLDASSAGDEAAGAEGPEAGDPKPVRTRRRGGGRGRRAQTMVTAVAATSEGASADAPEGSEGAPAEAAAASAGVPTEAAAASVAGGDPPESPLD